MLFPLLHHSSNQRREPRRAAHARRQRPKATHRLQLEQLEDRRLLSIFTVTTTSDDSDGGTLVNPPGPDGTLALREAVLLANVNPGPNTINFNIPTSDSGFNGQWWTIRLGLLTPLPTLTNSGTTINGVSQTGGASGTVGSGITPGVADSGNQAQPLTFQRPQVAIDANAASSALAIDGNASNITIQGLAVYDSTQAAVVGLGGSGTNRAVTSTFLGVLPNGSDPGVQRNMGFGVQQQSPGVLTVQRSFVGFNGQSGINGQRSASVLTVTQNEVFQNGWNSTSYSGIDLSGTNGSVQYNYSHDNTNSTIAVPNGASGNGLDLGPQDPGTGGNLVAYNTFSDNLSAGISVRNGASLNTIQKNQIYDNQVGISINDESGGANQTNQNRLSQNSIYMNLTMGIDLQNRGTDLSPWVGSPDGPDDPPLTGQGPGSNDQQNRPTLTSVLVVAGSSTTISGSLNSTANSTFTIEFFSTPDGTLFLRYDREGQQFIGSTQVTTDPTGNTAFSVTFPTALATDADASATATVTAVPPGTVGAAVNDTSEFSPSVPVADPGGKVNGGGWYSQPTPSSSMPNDAVAFPSPSGGRADFGINAQYKKNFQPAVPQGQLVFNFRQGNIHLVSSSYGNGTGKFTVTETPTGSGMFQASGNGLGKLNSAKFPVFGFRFNITVGSGTPTFHIKIWQENDLNPDTEPDDSAGTDTSGPEPVVYDNFPTSNNANDFGTPLGGGNIQARSGSSSPPPPGGSKDPGLSNSQTPVAVPAVALRQEPVGGLVTAGTANLATAVLSPAPHGETALWPYWLQRSVPVFSAGADGDLSSRLPLLEARTDSVDHLFATLEGDRLA